MVFVTVGTQKQSFKRIFSLVEHSTQLRFEEIVAQSGNTEFVSKKIEMIKFMDNTKFEELIEESDFVICHGGVGSIFTSLLKGKKVLAVPRLSKYGEHVDDHQIEICEELENLGYIIYYRDEENFDECIKKMKELEFKKYKTNDNFLKKIQKEI